MPRYLKKKKKKNEKHTTQSRPLRAISPGWYTILTETVGPSPQPHGCRPRGSRSSGRQGTVAVVGLVSHGHNTDNPATATPFSYRRSQPTTKAVRRSWGRSAKMATHRRDIGVARTAPASQRHKKSWNGKQSTKTSSRPVSSKKTRDSTQQDLLDVRYDPRRSRI